MAAVTSAEEPLAKAKAMLQSEGLAKAEEAAALLRDAQAKAREKGDKDGQVDAIKVLIDIHLAKKEHAEATQLAEQAVGILDDKSKKAKILLLLAQIQLSAGEGGQAQSTLDKAQATYKEAGDKAGEAETMGMIAGLHLEAGDLDAALKVARDAVDASPGTATAAMHTMAQVELYRENPDGAIEKATELLALCKDKDNKAGQASASLVLANAMLYMDGTSLEGLKCGREALALFQEVGDLYGTQSTLHTLANGYFARSDLEEGLKCAREALAIFRQTGDTSSEAVLMQTIEQARAMAQECRKSNPKRPFVLPPSAAASPPLAGPLKCPVADCTIAKEVLDIAAAGRKYWGTPAQVEADPTIGFADRAPNHSVIWGAFLSDCSPTQSCVEFGDLIACMAKGDVAKIPVVVLTCGVFGRQTGEHHPATWTNVSAATIWGMARTARQEMPSVLIQLLDYSEAMTAAEIPRTIRPPLPESAYYHKARWEPQIAAVHSLFRRELRRDNLTGGGAGGGGDQVGEKPAEQKKAAAKFLRKSFNWTGPSHKLDFCWYRQEWRACGPAFDEAGPMPPPPPCRAMRSC